MAQRPQPDGFQHHQHPVLAQRHAGHVEAEALFQNDHRQKGEGAFVWVASIIMTSVS